jgi:hypothetical protein
MKLSRLVFAEEKSNQDFEVVGKKNVPSNWRPSDSFGSDLKLQIFFDIRSKLKMDN